MSEQNSKSVKDFKAHFLMKFTKELIRSTEAYKKVILKHEVKEFVLEEKKEEKAIEKKIQQTEKIVKAQVEAKKEEIKEVVREKINRETQYLSFLNRRTVENTPLRETPPFESFFRQRNSPVRNAPRMLQIPETRLPPTVEHLRPIPTQMEVDLKKLEPLVRDPFVSIIECNGPGENIMVMGTMGRKRTGIVLTKEEIDEIIRIFSEVTKIPINEGIFKVAFGKLILSSIISDVIGSKFIIRKMTGSYSSFR